MEISFYLPEYWLGITTGCTASFILVVVTIIFAAIVGVRSDRKKGASKKKQ